MLKANKKRDISNECNILEASKKALITENEALLRGEKCLLKTVNTDNMSVRLATAVQENSVLRVSVVAQRIMFLSNYLTIVQFAE